VLVLNQDIIEISAEPVLRLWHSDEDRELQHCTLTVLQCVGDNEMTFELELWMDLYIVSEWIYRAEPREPYWQASGRVEVASLYRIRSEIRDTSPPTRVSLGASDPTATREVRTPILAKESCNLHSSSSKLWFVRRITITRRSNAFLPNFFV
jgi:hypothetical protein